MQLLSGTAASLALPALFGLPPFIAHQFFPLYLRASSERPRSIYSQQPFTWQAPIVLAGLTSQNKLT